MAYTVLGLFNSEDGNMTDMISDWVKWIGIDGETWG